MDGEVSEIFSQVLGEASGELFPGELGEGFGESLREVLPE